MEGLESGKIGAAGLDVYDSEPCTDSPLFAHPNVVATPHLGASTVEAQDKAGVTIAEQVTLALAGDFVPFAVNIDAGEVAGVLKPYLPMAEQLGRMFASMISKLPSAVTLSFDGDIGGYDNRLVVLSAIKGLLGSRSKEQISYVNADQLLEASGIEIITEQTSRGTDFVNLLSLSGGGRQMSATLMGLGDEARLVRIDGHKVDLPPADHMLIIRNNDHPGVIGQVATLLGDAGVNIDNMEVGIAEDDNTAIMVISFRTPPPEEVVIKVREVEDILSVDSISL